MARKPAHAPVATPDAKPWPPAWLFWIGAFLVAAWLATTPPLAVLNVALALALKPLALRWPWWNLVWLVGALPVTTLVVILAALTRRSARLVVAFGLGMLVEVGCKHLLPTPTPAVVVPPPPWPSWIHGVNITPAEVVALLPHAWKGSHAPLTHLVRGSFPSGHVFRLTFAWGTLRPPHRLERLVVAGLAGLAVTATGGHWGWDAVGAAILAQAALGWGHGRTPPTDPRGLRMRR